jgi:drug/metabolite transporter (DMT)-like permease
MTAVMMGVVVVARGGRAAARHEPTGAEGLRLTAGLALASAVGFAFAVLTAREASAILGEVQTVWGTRVISLVALVVFVLASRTKLHLPLRWWPALTLQAVLEVGALFALFVGIAGAGAPLASVAGSSSAIVTALLGRFILRERIRTGQWAGIALVASGVAALAYVSR